MHNLNKEKERATLKEDSKITGPEGQQAWEPMKMSLIGNIDEVVQGGGGKLSSVGTDPGESRKTSGQG